MSHRRYRLLRGLALLGVALVLACARPGPWLAAADQRAALAPTVPTRCPPPEPAFSPEGPVLLGGRPEATRAWAERAFPDHYRLGRGRGRFGLDPCRSPGAAFQSIARRGQVVFVSIQSHGDSAASAAPLSRRGVRRFLRRATGCPRFRLCRARLDLEEAEYRGYTTCERVVVPVRVVTPRYGRSIVAVATWLPRFLRPRREPSDRP